MLQKDLTLVFQKILLLLGNEHPLARCQLRILLFFVDSAVSLVVLLSMSHQQLFQNPFTISFSDRTKKFLLNCDYSFTVINKEWAIFGILVTITVKVNMIAWQMTLFSSSTFWVLSGGIFHFCMTRPTKLSSMHPHALFIFLCFAKYTFPCQRWQVKTS